MIPEEPNWFAKSWLASSPSSAYRDMVGDAMEVVSACFHRHVLRKHNIPLLCSHDQVYFLDHRLSDQEDVFVCLGSLHDNVNCKRSVGE